MRYIIIIITLVGYLYAQEPNDIEVLVAAHKLFWNDPNSVEHKIGVLRERIIIAEKKKNKICITYDFNKDDTVNLKDFAMFINEGYSSFLSLEEEIQKTEKELKNILKEPGPILNNPPVPFTIDLPDNIKDPCFLAVVSTLDANDPNVQLLLNIIDINDLP